VITETQARELDRRIGPGRVARDVALAPFTTFRIGGPADFFVRARTADELVEAVAAARALEVPLFLLGLGANILVGDRGFPGLVVRCEVGGLERLDERRIRVGSGLAIFPDLIVDTVREQLGGLHHYVGIPSTVGGAIWQNLHFLSPPPERERTCFIEEVVESCELLGPDGQRRIAGREELRFGYDYSLLHESGDIVLTTTFRLDPTPEDELRFVMRENLKWRDERHPDLWLYPCAGSIFRKIEGVGAGRLIDQCGLKGHIVGGAQIFHKHANIIVNLGGATAADVRALIALAQATVERELGHQLVPEIGFIGEF
jgi:UDP-N-acetylmuramate dehydrogenase